MYQNKNCHIMTCNKLAIVYGKTFNKHNKKSRQNCRLFRWIFFGENLSIILLESTLPAQGVPYNDS